MKKLLGIFILMTILSITGCGNKENVKVEKAQTDVTGKIQKDEELAKVYYKYLNETVIPERKLATVEPQEITVHTEEIEFGWDLWKGEGTGLVSAFLEDFDNDGILEMFAVIMDYRKTMNTKYRDIYFDHHNLDKETTEYQSMVLLGYRYDIDENGEVFVNAAGELGIMPTDGWGNMLIGIEKLEDEFYVFARVKWENLSTSVSPVFSVSELGTNNANWVYCSPINFGKANNSNYEELLGFNNTLDISITTLSELDFSGDIEENLGNRLLCYAEFDYLEFGGEDMVVTYTDYTDLRNNLSNNGDTWKKIELPKGGTLERTEELDEKGKIKKFVEQVSKDSGVVLNYDSVKDEGSEFGIRYTTDSGHELYVAWNKEKNLISTINLYSCKEDPDEEWYLIKDSILEQSELGLSTEDASKLKGEITDWLEYQEGIVLGNYKYCIHKVISSAFVVTIEN